jgi:hypothetical protein
VEITGTIEAADGRTDHIIAHATEVLAQRSWLQLRQLGDLGGTVFPGGVYADRGTQDLYGIFTAGE